MSSSQIARESDVIKNLLPLLGFVAAVAMAAPASAQEIKLTLADQNSPQAWGPSNALQPWIKQVEEATKGRVKIEVFPSQTLVKGPDMWRAVRSGIADIGWCFHGYWADQTPLADVITLPFLPVKSAEQASEVLWKLYEKYPAIKKEFSDTEPLLLYTTSPYFLLTTKKQVKTLDDLKGMKIRIPGGPPTEMAKALGMVPTPIPMPDMYQALDKGVVDGMGVPWEAVQGFRLYEVANNYTMVPMFTAYFSICANKQKWASLPADVRAHERERPRRREVLGQELLRYRGGGRARQDQGGQARDEPLRPAGGRGGALAEGRGRAAVGRVGQENGGARPQGGQADP